MRRFENVTSWNEIFVRTAENKGASLPFSAAADLPLAQRKQRAAKTINNKQ